MSADHEFAAAYTVRVLDASPASGGWDVELGRVGDGGLMLEVTWDGGTWRALVANGERYRGAHSGVHATPNPETLCVVARGDAYLVDVRAPDHARSVPGTPIVAVRPALDDGLLLLATPYDVTALAASGVAWTTARLVLEGIALGTLAGGELRGTADPDEPEAREFVIDLRTGRHRGGAPLS
jgi:hypothetical protein